MTTPTQTYRGKGWRTPSLSKAAVLALLDHVIDEAAADRAEIARKLRRRLGALRDYAREAVTAFAEAEAELRSRARPEAAAAAKSALAALLADLEPPKPFTETELRARLDKAAALAEAAKARVVGLGY
jgi:hypothetical protein